MKIQIKHSLKSFLRTSQYSQEDFIIQKISISHPKRTKLKTIVSASHQDEFPSNSLYQFREKLQKFKKIFKEQPKFIKLFKTQQTSFSISFPTFPLFSFTKSPEKKKAPEQKPPPRAWSAMETKLILSTAVFGFGLSYYSMIRYRMIPKTINRLKKGFYPYHTTHLANKSIYRMKDINAIERIIKMNRNDAKYYLVTGQKGKSPFN